MPLGGDYLGFYGKVVGVRTGVWDICIYTCVGVGVYVCGDIRVCVCVCVYGHVCDVI